MAFHGLSGRFEDQARCYPLFAKAQDDQFPASLHFRPYLHNGLFITPSDKPYFNFFLSPPPPPPPPYRRNENRHTNRLSVGSLTPIHKYVIPSRYAPPNPFFTITPSITLFPLTIPVVQITNLFFSPSNCFPTNLSAAISVNVIPPSIIT